MLAPAEHVLSFQILFHMEEVQELLELQEVLEIQETQEIMALEEVQEVQETQEIQEMLEEMGLEELEEILHMEMLGIEDFAQHPHKYALRPQHIIGVGLMDRGLLALHRIIYKEL